jgi:hypothetical protein
MSPQRRDVREALCADPTNADVVAYMVLRRHTVTASRCDELATAAQVCGAAESVRRGGLADRVRQLRFWAELIRREPRMEELDEALAQLQQLTERATEACGERTPPCCARLTYRTRRSRGQTSI